MDQLKRQLDPALDAALQLRRMVPPPSADLAARIAMAARRSMRPLPTIRFTDWLQEVFADLMLPRPSYALSGLLVTGFLIGFVITPIMPMQNGTMDAQNILADAGDMP